MKAISLSSKAISLLTILFFSLTLTSISQETFRLSDYKNPDYRWKKLDIGFGLGGNNDFRKSDVADGILEKNMENSISSNFKVDYYGTKNTSFYQGYQVLALNGNFGYFRDKYENDTDDLEFSQKRNFQDFSLSGRTVNRFYNRKKQFLETDLVVYGRLNNSNNQYADSREILPYNYKSTDQDYRLNVTVPLLVGTGRIEEVQDARLAVYILDDLATSGDLKRIPTNEEVMAFAQFITQTKNQRYFDSRLRKIAEITAIDSFLTVLDLKADSDASYFTLLNDNWDNSMGPLRKTGGRFSVGVIPGISLYFDDSEDYFHDTLSSPEIIENYSNKSIARSTSSSLDFTAGYTWEKPASLYWQHSINTDLTYALAKNKYNWKSYVQDTLSNETDNKIVAPYLNLNLGYIIGYYPNSRTMINLMINTRMSQIWQEVTTNDEPGLEENWFMISNGLNLSCYYYVSPRLRFSLYINTNYSFVINDEEQPADVFTNETINDFNNSISASLTYSIF